MWQNVVGRFDPAAGRSLRRFVYEAVRRVAVDSFRRDHAQRRGGAAIVVAFEVGSVACSLPDPEAQAIARDLLERALAELPELHRSVDLDPLSLLCRLATAVPPPRFNTVRYAGVLAAASTWRARVVPPLPPPAEGSSDDDTCPTCTAKDKPPTHRSGYRPWAELLKRTFRIEVELCGRCGGRMKLRALVITAAGIRRYLRWLGEPTEPPTLAPARDPPFFKSRAIRRRLGEPAQAELFDAH